MSERAKRWLVALWLFVSFPINVAALKVLIRTALFLFADLDAELRRWLPMQYLVFLLFVLWVIFLLISGKRLGHVLSIVLLVGSCCTLLSQVVLDFVAALEGYSHWPSAVGWMAFGIILTLNIVCAFALGASRVPSGTTEPSPAL